MYGRKESVVVVNHILDKLHHSLVGVILPLHGRRAEQPLVLNVISIITLGVLLASAFRRISSGTCIRLGLFASGLGPFGTSSLCFANLLGRFGTGALLGDCEISL